MNKTMTEYEKQKEWIRDKFRETMQTECERKDKRIAELEKENAELKEYNKYLRRKRQGGIQKQYNKVAIIKQQHDQLTKAKELLAKWVELFKPKGGNIPPTPIQVETEQFLSEVEK